MISTGLLAAALLFEPDAPAGPVVRFTVPVGEGTEVYLGGEVDAFFGRPASTSLAISPDGNLVVYSGWENVEPNEVGGPDEEVESRLYLRRLDQERADPIEGTEGASDPFFSPDGDWIGFIVGRSLRRVSVVGSTIETIVTNIVTNDGPPGVLLGATWGDDGTIVVGTPEGLFRVAENGGDPELVAAPDSLAGFLFYAAPHKVPGSDLLLFHGRRTTLDPEQAEIFALDLVTGNQTSLLTNAMDPHYVETGHLIFMRQGTLMAVAFDPDRVAIEGQPVIVLEDVMQAVGMPNTDFESGSAQLAVSTAGHVAYASGGIYPERSNVLMRVVPGGEAEPLALDARGYMGVRGSPEGDRLAFAAQTRRAYAIYVHNLVRGVTEQLNTGGFGNWPVEWSPDGTSIALSSDREEGVRNVYRMAADGSSDPVRVAPSDQSQILASWSSQDVIAYLQGDDIWVLPPDGEPAPFFTSDETERYATFSPDGRWLAYTSNQTGENEVYVRPYPGPVPATRISSDGGVSPTWSRDGGQIYFLSQGGMMVVDVTPGDPFRVGPAESLIDPWPYGQTIPVRSYDVLADGSFIVTANVDGDEDPAEPIGLRQRNRVSEFHVVLNFFEVLKERVGN